MKLKYLLARLAEPSTYAGFATIAVAFGAPADSVTLGVKLVATVAGIAAVILPERKALAG